MKFQIKSYGLDESKLTSWAWHDGSSWRSATSWRPLRDEHRKRLLTKKTFRTNTESRTKSCACDSPHSFLVMKMSMLSVGRRYSYEAVFQSYCNVEICLEVALTEFALGLGHGPRPPGPLKTQKEMLVCV